jgi:hypothetical protein
MSEIPNSKPQISNKFEKPIPDDQNAPHPLPLPPGEREGVRGTFLISNMQFLSVGMRMRFL